MASVNRATKTSNFTNEGMIAARTSLTEQLERSVMSCLLWENEFYEDGTTIAQRIADLVGKCLPGDVARIAIQAKEDMRLRHVPLLIAREMLRHKTHRTEFGRVAARVFTRADDISEFLAIYWKDDQKAPLAKQVKKHVGEAFKRFDEYQLAKYNGGNKTVKLRDAIRILRPKPDTKAQSKLWQRLVKNELKTPDTWEVELSASKDKRKSWIRLLKEKKLGGMAMLRNIRNMNNAEVSDTAIKGGIKAIDAGRLLPINFITAAKHNPSFESQIEAKFLECFKKKALLTGKTVILVDISPSMHATLSSRSELTREDVACSLAMIAREMFEDVRIFSFADNRVEVPARRGFSLRDAIKNSQPSNGTLLGKALQGLPAHDRLIVITDEESHDPVPQMKGYMINIASTQHGVGYGKWTHINGWSDKVLDYVALYERGWSKELKAAPVKKSFAKIMRETKPALKRKASVKIKPKPIKKAAKKSLRSAKQSTSRKK